MRIVVYKIDIEYNQKSTFKVKPTKEHTCAFIQLNQGQEIKAKFKKGYYSHVKQEFSERLPIPCLGGINKEIEVEITKTNNVPEPLFLTVVMYSEDEIGEFLKKKINPRILPAKDYGEILNDTTPMLLYKNRRRHNVFLAAWGWYTLWESAQGEKLYIDEEQVAFLERPPYEYGEEVIWRKIGAWLKPKSKVHVVAVDLYPDADFYWKDHIMVGDNEFDPQEIFKDYFKRFKIPDVPQIPEKPLTTEKPTQLPKPNPLPPNIPPYPEQPPLIPNPVKPKPPEIPTNVTIIYTNTDNPNPTKLERPGETPFVESMPSPIGMVRKTADQWGRQRTTKASITYHANSISVNDTNTHTLFTYWGTRKITLIAEAEDWDIKILPLYDWLAGRTIDEMDTIHIAAGQKLEMEIEAREVQGTCTTASATTTGKISWIVEI